jgi:hypothetical protein
MGRWAVAACFLVWDLAPLATTVNAQGSDSLYMGGMRVNLNKENNNRWIRFITWHQFWARYQGYNPGTVQNGEEVNASWNYSIRRSRFLVMSQISPRFLVYFHWGINNQTTYAGGVNVPTTGNTVSDAGSPKKPQIFVHEAVTEFSALRNDKYELSIGGGLHYWNGISRLTSASTINIMTADLPITDFPTIETTDQFARQLGIYAKGWLFKKLEYRVAVNQPFGFFNIVGGANPNQIPLPAGVTYNPVAPSPFIETRNVLNNNFAYAGYFKYDFWDKESNVLPYYVGSYVGTKKVFNIGAGFYLHPQSMGRRDAVTGSLARYDTRLLGVDAFIEYPFAQKRYSVSSYLVYYNYDFGPLYVRNAGIDNPASPDRSLNNGLTAAPLTYSGAGNAFPIIGTGQYIYNETALALPQTQKTKWVRVQPFYSILFGQLPRLASPVVLPSMGFNLYLAGHHAKLTFEYRDRPFFDYRRDGSGNLVFDGGLVPNLPNVPIVEQAGRRGEFILQAQIAL